MIERTNPKFDSYCVSSPYEFKIKNKIVIIKNLKTGYWQNVDLIV